MKKKIFILCLTASMIFAQGCTILKNMTSTSKSAITQENIASAVDINQEIFASGDARIEESGKGVAKMRAKQDAREKLRKKLFKESETILKAYLLEINFYSRKISDQVLKDLGEYVAEGILFEAEEKTSWSENNKMYVVLSVDKDAVPVKTKETFIGHIDSIQAKLKEVREKIQSIPVEGETFTETTDSDNSETDIILEENSPLLDDSDEFIDVQL
ncbi:hypothetical protein [uncultured Ilyobacter sp.]|uniref:hypothetical protein n=1 Tax=uncultured Ilyobacter sp. TaxID=544433 RepID=UPI002AA8B49E|nr:hypothetical protein [uncultured Ilyobacter sp.]